MINHIDVFQGTADRVSVHQVANVNRRIKWNQFRPVRLLTHQAGDLLATRGQALDQVPADEARMPVTRECVMMGPSQIMRTTESFSLMRKQSPCHHRRDRSAFA